MNPEPRADALRVAERIRLFQNFPIDSATSFSYFSFFVQTDFLPTQKLFNHFILSPLPCITFCPFELIDLNCLTVKVKDYCSQKPREKSSAKQTESSSTHPLHFSSAGHWAQRALSPDAVRVPSCLAGSRTLSERGKRGCNNTRKPSYRKLSVPSTALW